MQLEILHIIVHQRSVAGQLQQKGSRAKRKDVGFSCRKERLLASTISKLKTNMPDRIGKIGEPVAYLTNFGWMIMSQEKEDHSNMYLTLSNTNDYEHLYRFDVLGLANTSNVDQYTVDTEF